MKQVLRFNKLIKTIIITGDLCLLNIVFIALFYWFDYQTLGEQFHTSLPQLLVVLNLVYLLCNYSNGVVLHERIVRPERIVRRALRKTIFHALVFISLITLAKIGSSSIRFFSSFYVIFFIILVSYRLTFRYLLKQYRKFGGNSRTAILVGSNWNMVELYTEMTGDPTTGYRVIGYFDDSPSDKFKDSPTYLGKPQSVVDYLQRNPVQQVYCCLPSVRSNEIIPIINYCESHMIRFYSVPNVRNYLHRHMHFEMFGNVPVLSIREEPLAQVENQLLKRLFDILFSGLFLCTIFPFIYLVIGIAIKVSSPGPIFFKQKRSGENGKEFWCYKFRSMRVNAESDTLQATEHDPRKTRIGDFIRKTSIDELPQFLTT